MEKFVLTHGENGENFPLDDYWLLRKVYYMAVFMAKSDWGEMKGLVPKLPKKLEVLSEHECAEDRVLADSVAASVAALEKVRVGARQHSNQCTLTSSARLLRTSKNPM